jgi:hypothetical protein
VRLGWEGFEIILSHVAIGVTEYVGVFFALQPFVFPVELDNFVGGAVGGNGVEKLAIHL